ncbi:MAK10-like protein [Tanacetum coccineum]|uniref:MAK10-like protein n=1 Tax=Tanacetum coccineum TaxID=301880 RepID=A0ABQ5J337_9ASTR
MRDVNPIHTLGDYSKPSHEGYMNTIELPVRNNVGKNASATAKLRNDIQMFQQHHGESLSKAWTYFKDLLQKVPHHGIDLWLQVQIFYDHVNSVTRRTIDQSTSGKLRDRNAEESQALLEDLALYDNENVPSTSDRCLIELENQVQCLMESHLASMQPTQVNKITTSCEICSDPHDTQYCMENPEQAFVEYASSRTDKAGDARLSKFEADFKQQQSEMTNKIDTVLKAITDQLAGSLPSDTVKNPKLSTSLVLSARIRMQQPDGYEPTLEDEFQDLHLNLPVLEVLAHALIYNVILDKYMESLELSKNGPAFVQGEVSTKMEDLRLFTLPCRLGDSKPFDTLADLGSRVNIIPLYLFKNLNIGLLEETDHIFGLADRTKSYPVRIVKDVEVHIGRLKLLNDFYNKPPKNEDGAWHAKIRLIDPDGEEFTKTLQSIPTTRKLSKRESPREIIDLDHFYDT